MAGELDLTRLFDFNKIDPNKLGTFRIKELFADSDGHLRLSIAIAKEYHESLKKIEQQDKKRIEENPDANPSLTPVHVTIPRSKWTEFIVKNVVGFLAMNSIVRKKLPGVHRALVDTLSGDHTSKTEMKQKLCLALAAIKRKNLGVLKSVDADKVKVSRKKSSKRIKKKSQKWIKKTEKKSDDEAEDE